MEHENYYWQINGDEIIHCKKVGIRVDNNLFIFENQGNYGIINQNFDYIIPPKFENIMFAFREHFWVKHREKWNLINIKGEIIITQSYAEITPFKKQYACVSLDGRNYGFINKTGEIIIPFKYMKGDYLGAQLFIIPKIKDDFGSPVTRYNLDGKIINYGVIDLNEKLIHPYELNHKPTLKEMFYYLHKKRQPLG